MTPQEQKADPPEGKPGKPFCDFWSGREDLNLRPLGPDPKSDAARFGESRRFSAQGSTRVVILTGNRLPSPRIAERPKCRRR
jgi:hypothetical protein